MSLKAMAWAIEQSCGSPSTKVTLWSIANAANPETWCGYPSQGHIAEETEQSPDTVQRKIPELVERGLIRRIPLRFGGRKSVDFYILQPSRYFNAPLTEIEPLLPRGFVIDPKWAAENEAAGCGCDENGTASTTTLPQTLPQATPAAAATVRQHEPVREPEELPPTPLTGGCSGEPPNEEKWGAFVAAFTGDGEPIGRPSIAKPIFVEMLPADQQTAIQAALGYIAIRKTAKRAPQKMAAQTFLRERDAWAGWASHAPSAPIAASVAVAAFSRAWWWLWHSFVRRNAATIWSRDSFAAQELFRRSGGVSRGLPWVVKTPEEAAAAQAAGEALVQIQIGTPEADAWRQRYAEIGPKEQPVFRRGVSMPMPDAVDWIWVPAMKPEAWLAIGPEPMAAQEHEEA